MKRWHYLTEAGPIQVFAVETAKYMAEAQKVGEKIARGANKVIGVSARLMPNFVIEQTKLLAKDISKQQNLIIS